MIFFTRRVRGPPLDDRRDRALSVLRDLLEQPNQLMAQDRVLEFRLSRLALVGAEHSEDPAQEQIDERPDHGAGIVADGP